MSPFFLNVEKDRGDAVNAPIDGPVQLLAKNVGIHLFVIERHWRSVEKRLHGGKELVDPSDDRRACIEKQSSVPREMGDSFPDNVERKLNSKFAASVPIEPLEVINEVGGIGDDIFERAARILEEIAMNRLSARHPVKHRIDAGKSDGFWIDVGESKLDAGPQQVCGQNSACAAAASDVDEFLGPNMRAAAN